MELIDANMYIPCFGFNLAEHLFPLWQEVKNKQQKNTLRSECGKYNKNINLRIKSDRIKLPNTYILKHDNIGL